MDGLIGIYPILALGSGAGTLAVPELEGIALFQALVVPAVGAQSWEGEIHLAIELEFLRDDLEGSGALFLTPALMAATNDLV